MASVTSNKLDNQEISQIAVIYNDLVDGISITLRDYISKQKTSVRKLLIKVGMVDSYFYRSMTTKKTKPSLYSLVKFAAGLNLKWEMNLVPINTTYNTDEYRIHDAIHLSYIRGALHMLYLFRSLGLTRASKEDLISVIYEQITIHEQEYFRCHEKINT